MSEGESGGPQTLFCRRVLEFNFDSELKTLFCRRVGSHIQAFGDPRTEAPKAAAFNVNSDLTVLVLAKDGF